MTWIKAKQCSEKKYDDQIYFLTIVIHICTDLYYKNKFTLLLLSAFFLFKHLLNFSLALLFLFSSRMIISFLYRYIFSSLLTSVISVSPFLAKSREIYIHVIRIIPDDSTNTSSHLLERMMQRVCNAMQCQSASVISCVSRAGESRRANTVCRIG